MFQNSVYSPHSKSKRKIPRLQNPENRKIPELHNFLLSLQKSRKTNIVWAFLCVCVWFLFLKLYYTWQGFWWPKPLAFPFTCPWRKVSVLREAGETHLPQDCCSHQLVFPHIPSLTCQALRAICAGITDAQHSCRAMKHHICQVFLLWEHWKQRRNTNP